MRNSLLRRACTAAALLLTTTLIPSAAAATPQPDSPAGKSASAARLLGETTVPHKMDFRGTTVGGLSGIDRDSCTGGYVFISDDRSYLQPARFYTAEIDVDEDGVHSVDFTDTHPFRQPDGSVHPSPAVDVAGAVDPEEIRVDPRTCRYWWGQEGNRPKTADEPVVQPSLQFASRSGAYRGQLPLPRNYTITRDEQGPRRNQSIEAFAFGLRGRIVTSVLEGPLIQDGPVPDTEHGALVRLTRQTRTGRVLGQYAYPIEKIFAESDPDSPWGPDTGVPSILAFPDDPRRFLVLERTWVAGSGYKIRLFEATTRGATDVRAVHSLGDHPVVPMRKKLLADFDTLGLSTVDNTEGMTWGPELATGERTLILVSDDNFAPEAVTQIAALAVR
ncbi:esterase-like activity of phytase family protein [Streptomyces sp. KLOTTS4A1]|uniref:esterase-like activity of phytase family protein n=1 Tax=Streptomyces sp. KLOTTS4A1 TaxID=3390996 RepID=UPI0039F57BA2